MRKKVLNSCAGMTLVEIMVVTVVIGVLFIGLFTLIDKVGYSILNIGVSLALTDQASEAMYWLGKDFINAKASSMGNLGYNPGFEEPSDLNSSPAGWEGIFPASYTKKIGLPEVRGGMRAIKLAGNPTDYFSNISVIPETKEYVASGWAKADNTTSYFSIVQSNKAEFTPAKRMANANNDYWLHLTTNTLLNAGQQVRMRLNYSGSNTWKSVYDPPGQMITSFCEYNGRLYTGTYDSFGSCYIYEYDGLTWKVSTTFGPIWGILSLCVYNGRLYAGINNAGGIYVFDGTSWSLTAFPGPSVRSMCVYAGKLYAGAGDWGAAIYDFDGAAWNISYTPPPAIWRVYDLCVYNNKLYAAAMSNVWPGTGAIYVFDGAIWSTAYTALGVSFGNIAVYNNNLYVSGDSNVYVFDGVAWNVAFAAPGDYEGDLCTYNNKLYIGNIIGASAIIFDWDSIVLNTVFTPPGEVVYTLCVYDGKLYAGTGFSNSQIYSLGGNSYFDEVSLSPVVADTTTIAAVPYEYSTTAARSGVTSWRRYRLRYVPKSTGERAFPGELWREYTLDGITWLSAGILDSGALCENVKSFMITNRNQESFEVELLLEKQTGAGKKKEYRLKSAFTPLVP